MAFSKHIFIIYLLLFVSPITSHSQGSAPKLIDWSHGSCDHNYEVDRLINRIQDYYFSNDTFFVSIQFKDNCCADFKPTFSYTKGALKINPYKKYFGNYCDCHCCFSLDLYFTGIEDTNISIYFENKRLIQREPYRTFPIEYEIIDNDTINRTNKYRQPVGLWKIWDNEGTLRNITMYAFHEERLISTIWERQYHENGMIKHYYVQDTILNWHSNGVIKNFSSTYMDCNMITRKRISYYQSTGHPLELIIEQEERRRRKRRSGPKITHHIWKWNENEELIQSPKKWKGPLPDFPTSSDLKSHTE